jgi:hypothetical protein
MSRATPVVYSGYALITLSCIREGRAHKNLPDPHQAFLFLFLSSAIPFCKL